MVHAGVILLIRITSSPASCRRWTATIALALAGLATAVYGWLCGRVQSDVKSALVYATVMQVGLMVAACGFGWFDSPPGIWRCMRQARPPVPDGAFLYLLLLRRHACCRRCIAECPAEYRRPAGPALLLGARPAAAADACSGTTCAASTTASSIVCSASRRNRTGASRCPAQWRRRPARRCCRNGCSSSRIASFFRSGAVYDARDQASRHRDPCAGGAAGGTALPDADGHGDLVVIP